MEKKKVEWCHCGLMLNERGYCKRHGLETHKEPRQKIGRWSGKSKNKEYGLNWEAR